MTLIISESKLTKSLHYSHIIINDLKNGVENHICDFVSVQRISLYIIDELLESRPIPSVYHGMSISEMPLPYRLSIFCSVCVTISTICEISSKFVLSKIENLKNIVTIDELKMLIDNTAQHSFANGFCLSSIRIIDIYCTLSLLFEALGWDDMMKIVDGHINDIDVNSIELSDLWMYRIVYNHRNRYENINFLCELGVLND